MAAAYFVDSSALVKRQSLRAGDWPNCRKLADRLEVDRRTVRRHHIRAVYELGLTWRGHDRMGRTVR